MSSISERVAAARRQLRDAGLSVEEADLSARLLAEHLLGWPREKFLTESSRSEPHDFAARYDAVIARRAAREPLPYITGQREFWGLSFEVTPDGQQALHPGTRKEIRIRKLGTEWPSSGIHERSAPQNGTGQYRKEAADGAA